MWIIRPDYEYMGRSVGRIVFMFKQLANLQSAMAEGAGVGGVARSGYCSDRLTQNGAAT